MRLWAVRAARPAGCKGEGLLFDNAAPHPRSLTAEVTNFGAVLAFLTSQKTVKMQQPSGVTALKSRDVQACF